MNNKVKGTTKTTKLFVAIVAGLVLITGLLLLPNVAVTNAATSTTLYLETSADHAATGASTSLLWSSAAFDDPNFADVFLRTTQTSPVNTVTVKLQVSPDDIDWFDANTAKGDDWDDDSGAAAVMGPVTADTNAYWNGPVHGKYVRLYYTMEGTTTVVATCTIILHD